MKILGGKLKKSAARKEPPSAVLQAMQQQRQEAEGLEGQATLGHGVSLMPPLSPTAAIAAGAAVVPAGRMGCSALWHVCVHTCVHSLLLLSVHIRLTECCVLLSQEPCRPAGYSKDCNLSRASIRQVEQLCHLQKETERIH